MESGVYAESRSHHDVKSVDGATEALLTNTFCAPLPYVGTTLSGLKEYPVGADQIATLDTGYPHHYTSWNFQTRGVITSFFSLEPAAVSGAGPHETQDNAHAPTFLVDGALQQILRLDTCLSTTEIVRLRAGTAWLTNGGYVVYSLPRNARMRSAAYPAADAEIIANSIGAPIPEADGAFTLETPRHRMQRDELAAAASDDDTISSASDGQSDNPPTEPAERSNIKNIPARAVKVRYVSFQSNSPVTPPLSSTCQQIQALMANSDRSVSQPLISTVRSPLARDMASIQMLISYMSTSNSSHIETAAVVRGLCYAAAQCGDAFDFDRLTNHFLRREDLSHQPTRVFRTYNRPEQDRFPVDVIAVTLPAFTNHLKQHDTHLQEAGWALNAMDQTWVAVPITSDLANSPYVSEYLLCFLDTAVWAGRLSYSTQTQHLNAQGVAHRTHYTQIPHSHNISIPGPQGIMLVLLDESVTGANSHIPMLRPEGLNVYPGSPYIREPVVMADYMYDASTHMHDLMGNYEISASRMCSALEWIEANLCTDMAFQLAFSLAAELSAGMPESPTMSVAPDGAHRYQSPLSGAWTIGVHDFANDNPRHTTSNINSGPLANRMEMYTSRVCGYNWATVSPLLQYSQSTAAITNLAVTENNNIVAYQSYWTSKTLTESRPQYQCHSCHSVYRIMLGLGLIDKNDYKYELRTPAGLQSMLVMQGAALSMSLSLYLTNNDMDRWMWSGLHEDRTVAMTTSKNKLRSVLLGHVIPLIRETNQCSGGGMGHM